jgi:hypothetical protein
VSIKKETDCTAEAASHLIRPQRYPNVVGGCITTREALVYTDIVAETSIPGIDRWPGDAFLTTGPLPWASVCRAVRTNLPCTSTCQRHIRASNGEANRKDPRKRSLGQVRRSWVDGEPTNIAIPWSDQQLTLGNQQWQQALYSYLPSSPKPMRWCGVRMVAIMLHAKRAVCLLRHNAAIRSVHTESFNTE